MKIPKVHTIKLDDRSKQVVYLGKEPGTKAHRLFNPKTGCLHVSRDVYFEEKKGWNWKRSEEEGNVVPDSFITVEAQGGEQYEEVSEFMTPVHSYAVGAAENLNSSASLNTSSESSRPIKFRRLSDIYNVTEAIELAEELLFAGVDEPVTYSQAAKEDDWKKAMQVEIDAIEKNKTWVLTDPPEGRKPINLKWVYKLKKDSTGNIVKYKARLVAKGYVQKKGIDFDEVFVPVTRLETLRLLLALLAKHGWEVHHLDVKSAFLNGELLEEVYVSQPEGYVKKNEERKVYKLLKALYGLRQAPRAWYTRLNKCLKELNFIKCPYEHAVYTKREGDEFLVVGVYVDDLIVTGSNVESVKMFKNQMCSEFEMTDLGKLSYYLGLEVCQEKNYIELKQTAYAKKVLEKAGMRDCNPVKYPMEVKIQLHKDGGGKPVDETQFRSIIGGLRYLVHTRPDIAYSVGIVSRYMEKPTVLHLEAVKRILRYVKGTLEYGLIYSREVGNYILSGYADSDLAGSVDDRRSTGGMAFYLNDNLITWVS